MITDAKGRELPFRERIAPAHTALVVVDVQNDFALPSGVVAKGGKQVSSAQEMIERLKPLIDDARQAGVLVVYIRTLYDEPVLSRTLAEQFARRDFRNSLCLSGTTGADFVDAIAPRGLPNEVVVTKHRYSPFGGSDIDLVLRSNGIETVVLAGIVTEVCVESTARDAFFRDYRVVMAEDCASPFSAAAGAASQAVLNQTFGRLVPSTEIRSVWNAAPPGARGWQLAVKAASRARTMAAKIDRSHAALVLVNVQNDFCHAEGATALSGEPVALIRESVPRLLKLLAAARRAGSMVIHVTSEYGPLHRHALSSQPELCAPGSWGARVVDEAAPRGSEQVVIKHRSSGFADTRLDLLLRANDIRTVIVAGFATQGCVESTARDAAMRDYELVVAEDCVAAADRHRHLHEASLETLATLFGTVKPSSTLISAWREARAAADAELHQPQ